MKRQIGDKGSWVMDKEKLGRYSGGEEGLAENQEGVGGKRALLLESSIQIGQFPNSNCDWFEKEHETRGKN